MNRAGHPLRQRHRPWRGLLYQALALLLLVLVLAYLAHNTSANLQAKGIASGFDFLWQPAGFGIGEGMLPYASNLPYWRAFLAGVDNTVRVAVFAMLATTILGTALGLGRLSRNILLRGLCTAYVEIFRNIPLLLQLLACYALLISTLPDLNDAWQFGPHLYLSKSGFSFPAPLLDNGHVRLDYPMRYAFTIAGGGRLTPEFLALFGGLSLYTSAYLAETIRGGLQSVARGQIEAAAALGLSRWQTLRRVIVPQALRVIIPPATNQFSGLIKSSSLAIAIGYPDLVSVANTVLNQNGRAVECITLILLTYLLLTLLMAAGMHQLNRRAQSWAN